MTRNHVEVRIDNQIIDALVDSGASFSIISDAYRRHLRKTMFQDDRRLTLRVADGKPVQPLGRCILRLSIGGNSQPFEFIVLKDCSHDIILGWDFLEASQAIIDCGTPELQVDEIKSSRADLEHNFKRLCAVDDCLIPPSTIKQVDVQAAGFQNGAILFEHGMITFTLGAPSEDAAKG
ncbi:unnamed protein product [Larinioides sclopetarius]|uniref:Peptidase A2 domain-containing protein n=1 Tax=Larinioides sclopetarius TaxID=280406 RepID=A0AAV2ASB9_9ARAC